MMMSEELWPEMTPEQRIEWLAERVQELEERVKPLECVIKKIKMAPSSETTTTATPGQVEVVITGDDVHVTTVKKETSNA